MMTSVVPIIPRAEKPKTRRYSAAEWEVQKSNIERLYVTEDRPLKAVIQVLDHDFKFIATEKQLKSRLTQWGFDVKNLKSDIVIELARTKAKRALDNKKSAFRVNKKPVDDRKIDRCLQRNDISEEQLLSMASPINAPSPGFSVYTPGSVRSPAPDQNAATRWSRSPTPDLNFQSLALLEHQEPSKTAKLPTIPEEPSNSNTKSHPLTPSLYIQPGAESRNPSTPVKLPDGGILIVLGNSSMPNLNPEEVKMIVAQNNKSASANSEDIHRPSPYCGWEEEKPVTIRDLNNWIEWHIRLGMRYNNDEVERPITTPTKIDKGKILRLKPGSSCFVTYWDALEFEHQQARVKFEKNIDLSDIEVSCTWECTICGEHSSMTIVIDQCPGCGHYHCPACYYIIQRR